MIRSRWCQPLWFLARAARVCALLAILSSPARAQWPAPDTNLPVLTGPDMQFPGGVVRDGSGGAIVLSITSPGQTSPGIRVHHIHPAGMMDPSWPAGGTLVSGTTAIAYGGGACVADGSGGAFVAWREIRFAAGVTTRTVRVSHVLGSGAVDPAWPAGGCVVLSTTTFTLANIIGLVSDNAGGVFVAWFDSRTSSTGLYASRVGGTGTVDPAWPANGVGVLTTPGTYGQAPGGWIVPDGSGGAFVTWQDRRGPDYDVYVHHLLGSGPDPAWPANGQTVCALPGDQVTASILADGSGGVLVFWAGQVAGGYDLFAGHVSGAGVVDPSWPAGGRVVSDAPGTISFAVPVADGAGGALLAWSDDRNGNFDVFAHHILGSGAVDPAWPANGRSVFVGPGDQFALAGDTDHQNGILLAWRDDAVVGNADLYAHHVQDVGTLDFDWPAGGAPLSIAPGNQVGPILIWGADGGGIAVFFDDRSGNPDIYAQAAPPPCGRPNYACLSPSPVTADLGETVVLSFCAEEPSATSIQWYHGSTPISNDIHYSGSSTTVLTISDVGAAHAGTYRAALVNACGTTTTSAITLTVMMPFSMADAIPANVDAPPVQSVAAHFSGSGALDAMTVTSTGAVVLNLGLGDGHLDSPVHLLNLSSPSGLLAGFIDADGLQDVLVGSVVAHQVTYLRNVGGGFSSIPIAMPNAPERVGFGRSSLIPVPGQIVHAIAGAGPAGLWLRGGVRRLSGLPLSPTIVTLSNEPFTDVVLADLGQDGFDDVIGLQSGGLRVWLDQGTEVAVPFQLDAQAGAARLGVGDFDQDGWPDVVATVPGQQVVQLFHGIGNGSLGEATDIPTPGFLPRGIVVADFNGDGRPDLALSSDDDSRVGVLERNATGGWKPLRSYTGMGSYPGIVAGDFNGDSRQDLLVGGGTQIGVMLNQAAAVLSVDPSHTPATTSSLIASPNPFRSATDLRFRLPEAAEVRFDVFDVRGRHIRRLTAGIRPAGEGRITWDGRDDRGESTPAGLYFIRGNAGSLLLQGRVAHLR